ncbi:MAG: hypothetical protein ACI9OD_004355, partial [Limisphaerales bacterium]
HLYSADSRICGCHRSHTGSLPAGSLDQEVDPDFGSNIASQIPETG